MEAVKSLVIPNPEKYWSETYYHSIIWDLGILEQKPSLIRKEFSGKKKKSNIFTLCSIFVSSSEQNAVLKTIADVCHERVHLSLFPLWLHFFVKNLFLGNKKIVKLHHMQQCDSDNNLGLKIRKLSLTFSHIFMTSNLLWFVYCWPALG